ncbi:RHOMBOID-like protein 3 [Sesamum angolense]|uniref:RHOMBOID-like protein 3 n=2 Tax=Sesamum TaxID=4181 RepID=A0AAE1W1I4_9LAMI|nr:RHOMBOID-like protein 3 [Sesamum angolense]
MPGEDIESRVEKSNHSSTASAYSLEDRERNWVSWLIPLFVVANIVMFVVEMYLNNCPKRIKNRAFSYGDYGDKCVARFLGRLSFQPLRENPLFGPSSST